MSRRGVTKNPPTVLLVDDEADILELLEITLLRMGLAVVKANNVRTALQCLAQHPFDLCLTDMRLPDGDGLEVVQHIQSTYPHVPVAVITAHGNTENAVSALKEGAFDYINKPITVEQLRGLVTAALQLAEAPIQSAPITDSSGLLGTSIAVQETRLMIAKLARTQAPVYISGESGSGKELAARLIHRQGVRAKAPFVAVNCGAIPESLMESEFFGYRKGAFTGADHDKNGFFQAAQGGTLFLDEVAELPLLMQVKLLRAIQEKCVRPVGATNEEFVDVRIISATHQDLAQCVTQGEFRQDLFYRLNVIALKMPPLRERIEDIPLLAQAILQRLAKAAQGKPVTLSEKACLALQQYHFPGNVRELENILERAVALYGGEQIDEVALQLPEMPLGAITVLSVQEEKWPLDAYLEQVERAAIQAALVASQYDKAAAAKLLGITFRALRYRLERFGMG